MDTKHCRRCGEDRAVPDEWHKGATRPWCRRCVNAWQKLRTWEKRGVEPARIDEAKAQLRAERAPAKREAFIAKLVACGKPPPGSRACDRCGIVKPVLDFRGRRSVVCTACWDAQRAATRERADLQVQARVAQQKLARAEAGKLAAYKEEQRRRRELRAAEKQRRAAESEAERVAAAASRRAEKAARLNAQREHAVALRLARDIDKLLARAADHHAHVDAYAENRAAARQRRLADEPAIPPHVSPNRRKKLRRLYAIRRATPAWADRAAIDAVYEAAKIMTSVMGVECGVDHIVPLRHELVCGLHVPANLFPVAAEYNSQKGNRFWPDMP